MHSNINTLNGYLVLAILKLRVRSGCWYVYGSVLGRYGFIHWLLRGCARNWVKISLPKRSHSAIRRSTDPVSGATSNWPPARVTFHIYLHEVKWQPWRKWLTIGSITVSGKTPNLPTPNLCFFPEATRQGKTRVGVGRVGPRKGE